MLNTDAAKSWAGTYPAAQESAKKAAIRVIRACNAWSLYQRRQTAGFLLNWNSRYLNTTFDKANQLYLSGRITESMRSRFEEAIQILVRRAMAIERM